MKYDLLKLLMIISKNTLYTLIVLCLCQSLLLARDATGQSIHKVFISLDIDDAQVADILEGIADKTGFKFAYGDDVKAIEKPVTLHYRKASVAEILQAINQHTGIEFHQINETISAKVNLAFAAYLDSRTKSSQNPPPLAQIIRGKVTDESGTPLPGASVLVKGIAVGAVTDKDGNYVLEAPDEATTLVLSFIGYITEEVEIAGRSVIDLSMLPDIQSLQEVEVVSTGYYEVERRFNPGNIAKIDSEVIERQPVVNPLEALQGQVAGVFIEQTSGVPGAPININIRGLNSLNNGERLTDENGNRFTLPNSNLPFFVVDGVPYTSTSLNSDNFLLRGGNPLAAFRPGDIESIEVLKDADATAIYGSRGANGVILITTKKGQQGSLKLDVDVSRGIGEVPKKVDLLNTAQYLEMRREALRNDGFVATSASDTLHNADVFLWDNSRETDWQEELVGGTAAQMNASLTLSGGSARTQFLFRGSFFRQTNVYNYDNSAFEGVSGLLNLNHTSKDNRFNITSSVTYSANTNDQVGINFMRIALGLAPNAPSLYDEQGQINFADNFENPLADLERVYENKTRALVTNVSFQFELLPGLTFQSAMGYTNSVVNEISIIPLASFTPNDREINNGQSSIGFGAGETWIIEPQWTYRKELGKSVLNSIIGATYQGSTREQRTIVGSSYRSDLLIRDIGQAPNVGFSNNSFSEFRYVAIYARLNYVYDEKYVLNLTGRRDGSSRFGPGKRFGNFGAIGGAWIFTEESFMKDKFSFLGFGKLRASYGVTGNDQIGDYGYLDSYGARAAPFNSYNGNPALVAIRAANPEFSWETNRKLEVGLELGLLDDRINISTSWFRNRSDNQLIGRPLSTVTGFGSVQFNLPALVENHGIEVELNTVNINSGDFTWTSAFNFTRARNELLAFPNIEDFTLFDSRYIVGRSMFGSKEFRSLGVDPLTGRYAIADLNGDGRLDINDRQDFVEVFQDYYGGFSNSFSWKGFQMDIFLRFVRQNGRDFSTVPLLPGFTGENQPLVVLDRWQEPGDMAPFQKFARIGDANRGRHNNSGNTLVDASFIRLQNVSLSYSLPANWISRFQLSQARVYVNGQNLYTWTPYEGLDPEIQSRALPPLRMITTGLQLTF